MIKIDDEYSIERDTYCWILTHMIPTTKRDGTVGSRAEDHFFGTISQACMFALNKKIGNAKSLRDIIEHINEFEQTVLAAVKQSANLVEKQGEDIYE